MRQNKRAYIEEMRNKIYEFERQIDYYNANFPKEWQHLGEHCGFETIEWIRAWLIETEQKTNLFGRIEEKRIERKSFFRRLAEKQERRKKFWNTLPRKRRAEYLWQNRKEPTPKKQGAPKKQTKISIYLCLYFIQ